MTTTDRFERELAATLADRARASASPALRARLLAIPATVPAASTLPWPVRLGQRVVTGAAIAAVAAVLGALLLARLDTATVDEPVGAPTGPVVPAVPYVRDAFGVFSPAAVAEAERRLAAVAAATGVHALVVVQSEPSTVQLSTPEGWPDGFGAIGGGPRDVVAVIGVAPDGSRVCCLTLAGTSWATAVADAGWSPHRVPTALRDELASEDVAFRDVGLDRLVVGIEEMAPIVDDLLADRAARDLFVTAMVTTLLALPVVGVGGVALWRRRRRAVPVGVPDDTGTGETTGTAGIAVGRVASPALAAGAGGRSTAIFAAAVVIGLAAATAIVLADALAVPTAVPAVDVRSETIGLRPPEPSLALLAALLLAAVAGIGWAVRGTGLHKVAAGLAIVWIAGGGLLLARGAAPEALRIDRAWVGDPRGVTTPVTAGIGTTTEVALDPGQTYTFTTTIRNPGSLPVTILGLAAVPHSQPNPEIASIVGVGWIPQPTADGQVATLSADPARASASWPVTIRPGDELALLLIVRGGPCADAAGDPASVPLLGVPLTYRVLGIEQVAEIGPATALFVRARTPCTVATDGGTITYETP